jgi:hypothetical protein
MSLFLDSGEGTAFRHSGVQAVDSVKSFTLLQEAGYSAV